MCRSLQAKQLELERQQAIDGLKKGLEKRPERDELVESILNHLLTLPVRRLILRLLENILPDSTAAPSIQGQQRELAKHMRADSLEQKLQQRPKPDELVKEGILNADEDPTSPIKE